MSAELERLRADADVGLNNCNSNDSAVALEMGHFSDEDEDCWEVEAIRAYIAALESALAERGEARVVEAERCTCCYLALWNVIPDKIGHHRCAIAPQKHRGTQIPGGCDDIPPDWCPLRRSPVLLRLKDGV